MIIIVAGSVSTEGSNMRSYNPLLMIIIVAVYRLKVWYENLQPPTDDYYSLLVNDNVCTYVYIYINFI